MCVGCNLCVGMAWRRARNAVACPMGRSVCFCGVRRYTPLCLNRSVRAEICVNASAFAIIVRIPIRHKAQFQKKVFIQSTSESGEKINDK